MSTKRASTGARRRRENACPPNPAVRRCLLDYNARFTERFGFKPNIIWGKDGSLLKRLINLWGEEVVLKLIDQFFTTTDPRVVRSDYTIGVLSSVGQALRMRDTIVDQRHAENLDAAARASGRY